MLIMLLDIAGWAQVPATPPEPPGAGLSELRTFERQMLRRASPLEARIVPTLWGARVDQVMGDQWVVLRDHQPIDGREFAHLVGDREQLEAFERSMVRTRRVQNGAAVAILAGGLATVGVGTAAMADRNPENDTYGLGLALGGGVLGLGFAGFLAVAPVPPPTRDVDDVYSRADADQWIDRHNDALRQQLGLTEAQVAPLVLNR